MKPITFWTQDDDGLEREVTLTCKYEVCRRCRGKGTHTNPAIDGHGISSAEMIELGEDFREDYLSGVYDVRCEDCDGLRVVPVPDPDQNTAADLEAYRGWLQDEADYRAEIAAEQRMGA